MVITYITLSSILVFLYQSGVPAVQGLSILDSFTNSDKASNVQGVWFKVINDSNLKVDVKLLYENGTTIHNIHLPQGAILHMKVKPMAYNVEITPEGDKTLKSKLDINSCKVLSINDGEEKGTIDFSISQCHDQVIDSLQKLESSTTAVVNPSNILK